ncbi:hornerin-like isoform X2 [Macrosteles quadrilineatus]|uniref:hornerin-like isoform X2 n=1 Tax=Macrosteles quadrilineatus TaxID=74068 RepID=UPI0023E0E6BB|nr:hornerin-like isoform X2 [Macrosteles quadrilineatus]
MDRSSMAIIIFIWCYFHNQGLLNSLWERLYELATADEPPTESEIASLLSDTKDKNPELMADMQRLLEKLGHGSNGNGEDQSITNGLTDQLSASTGDDQHTDAQIAALHGVLNELKKRKEKAENSLSEGENQGSNGNKENSEISHNTGTGGIGKPVDPGFGESPSENEGSQGPSGNGEDKSITNSRTDQPSARTGDFKHKEAEISALNGVPHEPDDQNKKVEKSLSKGENQGPNRNKGNSEISQNTGTGGIGKPVLPDKDPELKPGIQRLLERLGHGPNGNGEGQSITNGPTDQLGAGTGDAKYTDAQKAAFHDVLSAFGKEKKKGENSLSKGENQGPDGNKGNGEISHNTATGEIGKPVLPDENPEQMSEILRILEGFHSEPNGNGKDKSITDGQTDSANTGDNKYTEAQIAALHGLVNAFENQKEKAENLHGKGEHQGPNGNKEDSDISQNTGGNPVLPDKTPELKPGIQRVLERLGHKPNGNGEGRSITNGPTDQLGAGTGDAKYTDAQKAAFHDVLSAFGKDKKKGENSLSKEENEGHNGNKENGEISQNTGPGGIGKLVDPDENPELMSEIQKILGEFAHKPTGTGEDKSVTNGQTDPLGASTVDNKYTEAQIAALHGLVSAFENQKEKTENLHGKGEHQGPKGNKEDSDISQNTGTGGNPVLPDKTPELKPGIQRVLERLGHKPNGNGEGRSITNGPTDQLGAGTGDAKYTDAQKAAFHDVLSAFGKDKKKGENSLSKEENGEISQNTGPGGVGKLVDPDENPELMSEIQKILEEFDHKPTGNGEDQSTTNGPTDQPGASTGDVKYTEDQIAALHGLVSAFENQKEEAENLHGKGENQGPKGNKENSDVSQSTDARENGKPVLPGFGGSPSGKEGSQGPIGNGEDKSITNSQTDQPSSITGDFEHKEAKTSALHGVPHEPYSQNKMVGSSLSKGEDQGPNGKKENSKISQNTGTGGIGKPIDPAIGGTPIQGTRTSGVQPIDGNTQTSLITETDENPELMSDILRLLGEFDHDPKGNGDKRIANGQTDHLGASTPDVENIEAKIAAIQNVINALEDHKKNGGNFFNNGKHQGRNGNKENGEISHNTRTRGVGKPLPRAGSFNLWMSKFQEFQMADGHPTKSKISGFFAKKKKGFLLRFLEKLIEIVKASSLLPTNEKASHISQMNKGSSKIFLNKHSQLPMTDKQITTRKLPSHNSVVNTGFGRIPSENERSEGPSGIGEGKSITNSRTDQPSARTGDFRHNEAKISAFHEPDDQNKIVENSLSKGENQGPNGNKETSEISQNTGTGWIEKPVLPATVYGDDKCEICPWTRCTPGGTSHWTTVNMEDDIRTIMSDDLDKMKLIPILAFRTENERKTLAEKYRVIEKVKLRKTVHDRITIGNRFQKTMEDLATPLDEFYAYQLNYILFTFLEPRLTNHPSFSIGKTFPQKVAARKILIQIIVTLTPCLMQKVREFYKVQYGDSLENDINAILSTHQTPEKNGMDEKYIKFITDLIKRESYIVRENTLDSEPNQDDQHLLSNAQFLQLSLPEMKKFVEEKGVDTIKAHLKENDMFDEELHTTILDIALNQQKFFADELRKMFLEKPFDDVKFINFMRGHFGTDLGDIQKEYDEESVRKREENLFEAFEHTDTTKKHYYNAIYALLTGKLLM